MTSNTSLQIRRAVPEDANTLSSLFDTAVRAVSDADYSVEEREAWRSSVSTETMREGLEDPDPITFVAEQEGVALGFATLDGSIVRSVYVRPDAQGGGIGSALLSRLEREARRQGVKVLSLSASLNAVPFYEAQGYEPVGQSRRDLGEGTEIQCIDMEKTLR